MNSLRFRVNKSGYTFIVLVILVLAVSLFYYYEVRPKKIIKLCNDFSIRQSIDVYEKQNPLMFISIPVDVVINGDVYEYAKKQSLYEQKQYDFFYKQCLRDNQI